MAIAEISDIPASAVPVDMTCVPRSVIDIMV